MKSRSCKNKVLFFVPSKSHFKQFEVDSNETQNLHYVEQINM